MRNSWKNNRGSAIIVVVFIALMGFFAVSLLASDIIKSNLIMSRTQLNSTKAYYAAEVGLEQALWGVMKGSYEMPTISKKKVFDYAGNAQIKSFLDNGIYNVDYNRNNAIRTFVSTGGYASEHRSTEVSFCIPDCFDSACGADDGCGQACPSKCTTDVGCHATAPADSVEVEGSTGACCSSEKCYQCAEGYVWDGSNCKYDCVQECAGLTCGQLDPNCNKPCPGSCISNPGCVASTDPQPTGTKISTGSCCDIAGTSYTCYECAAGYGWNGSACVACVANVGKPYPGSTVCYDAGIYDCFGNQVAATTQPAKGLSCGGGAGPQVDLGMNANTGNIVYDSSEYKNNGVYQGNDWKYRKLITIDHTKFAKDVSDFQFLLNIKDLGLFYYAQDDGDDILFKDASGNKIPHEIEYFQSTVVNSEMGRLVAWLRIPKISSSGDTKIYMYYGNATVANQQDPKAVWSGYSGVWHLGQATSPLNSANQVTGTYAGTVYPNSVTAVVAYGQSGQPINTAFGYGGSTIVTPSAVTGSTVSLWVRLPSNPGINRRYAMVVGQHYNGWSGYHYEGSGLDFPNGYPVVFSSGSGFSSGVSLLDGNWHNVVYTMTGTTATGPSTFYVDGQAVAYSSTGPNMISADYDWLWGFSFTPSVSFLGSSYGYCGGDILCVNNLGQYSFQGQMDELRLAYSPFDATYIKASYDNQKNPAASLTSIGPEENVVNTASWVPGVYGNALDFNGSSNYISFPTSAAIPLNNDLTLETWIYPTALQPEGIASKWGNSWGWYLNWNFTNSFYPCFYMPRSNVGTAPAVCATSAVSANTWTHIALTYNKAARQVTFYTNGVPEAISTMNYVAQGTNGDLKIGAADAYTSFSGSNAVNVPAFKGKIDEFKIFNYLRTPQQIQYDANENVCDGSGTCTNLSTPKSDSGTFKSCNDICTADGKLCSSVGTDTRASNGLMSVYNAGSCSTTYADCNTTMERNPNDATPFLCGGYQTNWTNCNCTVCAVNFGAPCTDNPCIVAGTGLVACDGSCKGAVNVTAGTSCGTNRECDGLGTCRNVCHPLVGKPCGADQCNNPGVVDCDGFCIGSTPKSDGLSCINTTNDPLQDQCWGGVCTACVPNFDSACNDGQCQAPGKVVCDGGCSACTDGDCVTHPSYAAKDTWCDSGYGTKTGLCNATGVCEACHSDYLTLGATCTGLPCHSTGNRDCKTGLCPASSLLPVDTYCTTIGGDPGACKADGTCQTCASGYMDACNNDQPCKRAGTLKCDGVTCTTSGYLNENDSCDAGHSDSWAYPNTGYCDASHNCVACVSGYLNKDKCNNGDCQVSGNYLCKGGCDACTNNDCITYPHNKPDTITTCDAGIPTTQPYSGTCLNGACNACDTKYLNAEKCNTEKCHKIGDYKCDGTCSTGTTYADANTNCDAGIYDGYPGRETGKCDGSGNCQTCNWYYIYDQPCKPAAGDSECYDFSKVTSCLGTCPAVYKSAGTTCSVDSLVSPLPYTGKCDGAGNCVKCDDLYINQTPCNNTTCHTPSTYNCEGTCLSTAFAPDLTMCNAGYPASLKYPNTGYCSSGTCSKCSDYYLNSQSCYPEGIADANKFCYNAGEAKCPPSFWYTSPYCNGWTYKGAGIPCSLVNTNECNGSGVCTTPLEKIVAYNYANYGISNTCQTICSSAPYAGRGCLSIGTDLAATNGRWSLIGMSYSDTGDCSTLMHMMGDSHMATYCLCGNCKPEFNTVCKAADQCNYQSKYMCNGTCPTNYIPNNTACDPPGDSIYGYCYTGTCLECTQVPGSACNVGECKNQGTYSCQGVCSTAATPNKALGTDCSGGGKCDGSGNCIVPSPLYNTACPIVSPKDEECYNPGVYNIDGTVCLNPSVKNVNGVCTVNGSGSEGRCSSAGDCVACSPLYNTSCPVNSPYVSFCYDAGKYTCDGLSCTSAFFKNQGMAGCGSPSYICNSGKCVLGVVGQVYTNSATGLSCDQVCTSNGYYCYGVGYDSLGSNGVAYSVVFDKGGNPTCNTTAVSCSTVMTNNSTLCSGYNANWTKCSCSNCNVKAWTSCESDAMWVGKNYDSECFNFSVYNCDGVCTGYGVINDGGTCTNASGIEGRCSAGVCNQCVSSYLNHEMCVASSCSNQVRQCDGTCIGTLLLGVGESCGTGVECDANGSCVPASTLVDIVVPNFATGQSCNNICSGYIDRHCKSVGTDGTQAGGTNGYVMYFGLSDGNPACISQGGGCSTIVGRNPSATTDPNYGYTCSSNLTNWTYCRCTNQ